MEGGHLGGLDPVVVSEDGQETTGREVGGEQRVTDA